MVELSILDKHLIVDVLGAHKLWALKSRLEIPLASVERVEVRPETRLGWWHGARIPGTHFPGVIVAGSYRKNGEWHFWDVSRAQNTVEISLVGHRYQKLFVEVAEPASAVEALGNAAGLA